MAWTPNICIYHGGCDDGFGAAWAIWRRWPDCEFVAGAYGKPLPAVDGRNVLFVDFSAKRPVLEEMAKVASSIVILDHHKTAEEDLAPFRFEVASPGETIADLPVDLPGILRDLAELGRPPIVAVFDPERSGATMAWSFAHTELMPQLLAHVEDRDLWRFALEDTRAISASLRTYEHDFHVWSTLAYSDVVDRVAEGEAILRAHRANIARFMRETRLLRIGGYWVPTVNVPYHYASDVAHELLAAHPRAPFAACWFIRGDGKAQFSLRSEDHRVDVSAVAASYGGGGHRNAAGFEIDLPGLEVAA